MDDYAAAPAANELQSMHIFRPDGKATSGLLYDYDARGNLVKTRQLGDTNCDGWVDGQDITPFVTALNDLSAYAAQYPDCDVADLDLNGDAVSVTRTSGSHNRQLRVMQMAMLPDSDSPGVVYDLRSRPDELKKMRNASLSSGQLGLAIEDGVIVGSPSWWDAIDSGKIEVQQFVGVIRCLDRGPMDDAGSVRIDGCDKTMSWYAWHGFNDSLVGKRVDIRYVPARPKYQIKPGEMLDVLVQVRVIDDSLSA